MNKIIIRNIIIFSALIIVPLFVSPWAIDPFEIDKVMVVRAIAIIAAITLISKKGIAWIKKTDIKDPGFWFMLLVAWSTFATIFSTNIYRSVFGSMLRGGGLITLICVFLLYVAFRSAGQLSKKTQIRIAQIMTTVAGIISIYAIAQYITHNFIFVDIMLPTTGEPFQLLRTSGTFGHPLYLAMYLTLSIPFIWFALKNTKNTIARYGLVGLGILMFIAIYLSRTRIALIALAVLMAVWTWNNLKQHRKKMIAAGGLLIMISFFIPSVQQTILRPQSLFVRAQEWSFSVQQTIKRPFFGYGFETYDALSYTRERHPDELQDGLADRVHNIWLDTAHNTGIPAMIILIGLCITVWKTKKDDEWIMVNAYALLAYLILMQTSFDHALTYAFIPFFLAQLSPQAQPIQTLSKSRTIIAVMAGLLILTPLAANKLMYEAKDHMINGEFVKEIGLYQSARLYAPFWPEIDVMEAEAWFGRVVMEAERADKYKAKAEQLMNNAHKKGLPYYTEDPWQGLPITLKPAFEKEIWYTSK